jgi:uncharacterized membrane protein (DUF106 family)
MAMSRRHYREAADNFAREYAEATSNQQKNLIKRLANRQADMFARDNSRFDRQRFLDACGF